jgi:hypothetical protein
MGPNREVLCEQVQTSIEKYKLGLDIVGYDVSFGWGPGGPPAPGQPPQLIMAYWIVISIRNPLLGQPPISHIGVMPNFTPTQKEIDDLVMQSLGQIRETKAKVLAVGNGQGAQNG